MIAEPDEPTEPAAENKAPQLYWIRLPVPDDGKPFMEMVSRLTDFLSPWSGAYAVYEANAGRPILREIVNTLSTTLTHVSVPVMLGGVSFSPDVARLQERVIELLPKTPERVAELEQAVIDASADPEKRKLVQQITELFSRPGVQKMSRWGVVICVSGGFLKVTENVGPNFLPALGIVAMVVIALAQSGFFNP